MRKSDNENMRAYRYYELNVPLVHSTGFDPNKENHEILIRCNCGKIYRVFVNGSYNDIPKLVNTCGAICPACGESPEKRFGHSMHSGGVFNAMSFSVR